MMTRRFRTFIVFMLTAVTCLVGMGCFSNKAVHTEIKPDVVQAMEDVGFLKPFQKYWEFRMAGDHEKAFKMEAPYFQEMVSSGKYKAYTGSFSKNNVVMHSVSGIEKVTEHLYKLNMVFSYPKTPGDTESGLKNVYMEDQWVKVNDQWFHVMRNKFLFPEAN